MTENKINLVFMIALLDVQNSSIPTHAIVIELYRY